MWVILSLLYIGDILNSGLILDNSSHILNAKLKTDIGYNTVL